MMSATQHLIFIDSELSDFSSIIENIPVGSTWFKIDGSSDGILEMESIAQNYSDLSSIQIVSHGTTGQLTCSSMGYNLNTTQITIILCNTFHFQNAITRSINFKPSTAYGNIFYYG